MPKTAKVSAYLPRHGQFDATMKQLAALAAHAVSADAICAYLAACYGGFRRPFCEDGAPEYPAEYWAHYYPETVLRILACDLGMAESCTFVGAEGPVAHKPAPYREDASVAILCDLVAMADSKVTADGTHKLASRARALLESMEDTKRQGWDEEISK